MVTLTVTAPRTAQSAAMQLQWIQSLQIQQPDALMLLGLSPTDPPSDTTTLTGDTVTRVIVFDETGFRELFTTPAQRSQALANLWSSIVALLALQAEVTAVAVASPP